jgi:hypothetical protein
MPPRDQFRNRLRAAREHDAKAHGDAETRDDGGVDELDDATSEQKIDDPRVTDDAGGAPPAPQGAPGLGGGWPAWAVVDWDALEGEQSANGPSVPPPPTELDQLRDRITSVASQAAEADRRSQRERTTAGPPTTVERPTREDHPTREERPTHEDRPPTADDAGDEGSDAFADRATPSASTNGANLGRVVHDEGSSTREDTPRAEPHDRPPAPRSTTWAVATADTTSSEDVQETAERPPADVEGATLRAEVVPRSEETGLSLSPERLWELVKEAAWTAQEARERAAQAEGESVVLRQEVERLRQERADLVALLAERRHRIIGRRR